MLEIRAFFADPEPSIVTRYLRHGLFKLGLENGSERERQAQTERSRWLRPREKNLPVFPHVSNRFSPDLSCKTHQNTLVFFLSQTRSQGRVSADTNRFLQEAFLTEGTGGRPEVRGGRLERGGFFKTACFIFLPRDGLSATGRGMKLDHWDDFLNKQQVSKQVVLTPGWVSLSFWATAAKIQLYVKNTKTKNKFHKLSGKKY